MATQRRLSHRQIAALLLEMECGMSQAAAAAENGVSKSALTAWKHYMGLNEKWLGRVKWLEHELKKLGLRAARAEQQVAIAGSVIKQLEPNPRRRSLFAIAIRAKHDIYFTRANQIVAVSNTAGVVRESRRGDAQVISEMRAYLDENPGEGFSRMFRVLLQDRRCTRTHALKLYTQERLSLHFRKNRVYLPGAYRDRVRVRGTPDRWWSLDFLVDALANGKRYWVLNAIDEFNRECMICKVLPRTSARALIAELESVRQAGRQPYAIRSDNGTEFKGLQYLAWCDKHGVKRRYSRPGRPTDNIFVERFNGTLRREVFNWYRFDDLRQVQRKLDDWRIRYNLVRPHESLGGMSPMQYSQLAKLGRG